MTGRRAAPARHRSADPVDAAAESSGSHPSGRRALHRQPGLAEEPGLDTPDSGMLSARGRHARLEPNVLDEFARPAGAATPPQPIRPTTRYLAQSRADLRRQYRARRRRGAAKGALVAAVALGVAGFGSVSLLGSQQGVARDLQGARQVSPAPGTQIPAAEVVRDRQEAVATARQSLEQAEAAKVAASVAAVPVAATQELDAAISSLRTVVAATQAAQPAVTSLQPAQLPAPVQPLAAVVAAQGGFPEPSVTATGTAVPGVSAASAPAVSPVDPDAEERVPADPAAAMVLTQASFVAALTAELRALTTQAEEAAAAAIAARAAEEEAAARKQAQRTSLDEYANGRIPVSALCELDFAPAHRQRCDATDALEELNLAFEAAFGASLKVTDSYRSYAAQVACRENKGSLCATPGTSNHGTGIAVDFGGGASSFGTREHDWLLDHAGEYGWTLPSWARASGSKPEPWHWEYIG